MKTSISLITGALTLTVFSAVAEAQDQPWLADRRYTEGIGVRVGDFELHPGLGAEFGYDSNYFRRSSEDSPGSVGSLRLRISPSFSISSLTAARKEANGGGPPDFEFRGGVHATYDEFIPVTGSAADQDLMRSQRNLGGTADLGLNILPGKPWSGNLYGDVTRALRPSEQGITSVSFNRDIVRAGGELVWTPGGGLLDWRLGYRFGGTFFESSQYASLTNLDHTIETRGRWRFLPRTALMYDMKTDLISYPQSSGQSAVPGVSAKTSSTPVRALIGVNGLITPSFGVLALVGWGASFYSNSNPQTPPYDFDSVIGQAEVRWYITPNPSTDPGAATLALSSIALGFNRDFVDSYIGTYYERDRGYANLSYFFGGRFLVSLDGGVGPIVYPKITLVNGGQITGSLSPFSDIRADGTLFGEYRFKDYFGINATFRYGQNISSTSIPTLAGSTCAAGNSSPGCDHLDWQEFEAYLGLRWFL